MSHIQLPEFRRRLYSAIAKMEMMLVQGRNKNPVTNKVELSSEELEALLLTLGKLGIKRK